jgi:hypothetical protein
MRKPEISRIRWAYDAFNAFHVKYGPSIFFDTGELICTTPAVPVGDRYTYSDFNVELTTTKQSGTLWAPDGLELKTAWLDDGGQQHLLIDHDLNVAVRTDGAGITARGKLVKYMPGVPERFQTVYAYIGGPGCMPVGAGEVTAWVPHRMCLIPEQREHVQMLEQTARAALKLTDHEVVSSYPGSKLISSGCPLDVALKASTWQDLTDYELRSLFHHGVARRKLTLPHALTVKP